MQLEISILGALEVRDADGDGVVLPVAGARLRAMDAGRNELWPGPPQVLANRDVCAAHLHLAAGDLEAARVRLAEAFQHGQIAIDMPVLSRLAIAAACYTADQGDAPRAARVLGIAAGLRGAADLGDEDRRRLDERLRSALGDVVFDDAYAAGLTTPREQCRPLLARILEPPSAAHGA